MDAVGWLAVTGGAALVLVVADRVVARLPPRGPAERAAGRPGPATSGFLGDLVEVFQPSARHLHEEQERRRHDLVEVGDADPPWQVDLDAGTAVLGRRPAARELADVAPGVLVATAQPWHTTTSVVVGPGGRCLVVDPALTPADLHALAAALRARGLTVEAGASTHPHWDHVLWSRTLGDVPRWAAPDAVRHAAATADALLAEAAATAPGHDPALLGRLSPLTGDDVPWSGPRVLAVPHEAHCAGSVALVVPEARVLLAGDLLSDVEVPLLDLDHADPLGGYRDALDALEDAAHRWSVRVLVPGHGRPTDTAGMRRRVVADRAYLAGLESAAHARRSGSEPDADGVADARLADPEQRAQHSRQLAELAGR